MTENVYYPELAVPKLDTADIGHRQVWTRPRMDITDRDRQNSDVGGSVIPVHSLKCLGLAPTALHGQVRNFNTGTTHHSHDSVICNLFLIINNSTVSVGGACLSLRVKSGFHQLRFTP